MAKKKQKTPYDMLLEKIRDYVYKITYPMKKTMFFFGGDDLGKAYYLKDVYERTVAANTLGYDVILETKTDKKSLEILYRKRTEPNWKWK